MGGEELLAAVERDPVARLKWIVLQRLGVSPVSWQARFFSGRRAVACACQMILDQRGASALPPETVNGSFDPAKFEEMRRASWGRERKE
ncbi:MAG: hypothetical protein ACI4PC_07270 [Oscillospiraceae bacterium]